MPLPQRHSKLNDASPGARRSFLSATLNQSEPGRHSALLYPLGRGVRQKLVLVSLLILVVVSFGFSILQHVVSSSWVDDDLKRQAITFAQQISVALDNHEEFEGGPGLQADIEQILATRPNVRQIDILKFTPGGSVVIASSNAKRRLPFDRHDGERVRRGGVVSKLTNIGNTRAWDILVPLDLDEASIGAVSTRFSLEHADRLRFRITLWGLVFTGVAVLLMGYLMAAAVSYTVNRPIASFMAAIRKIRDGSAEARVEVESADEFAVLADHFNEMMERINRFNDELDDKISTATRELDEKYQEVQRLNATLYTTQHRLSQAERLALVGQVVAQVAHEVGTPLHSLAGHLELLRSELPPAVAEQAARRLEVIESQIARLSGVIRQLLDLARRERSPFASVDVGTLLQASADLISPGLTAAGIELHLNVDSGLPAIRGNRDQLMQVVLNLLTNATEATTTGDTIEVAARRRGEYIEISVRDSGAGIPLELQGEIFEPFVSSKPPSQGTGLGLYIANQIVRDHDGHIEVQSQPDHGSIFKIVLPVTVQ